MVGQWVSDGSSEIIISADSSEIKCQLEGSDCGNVYNGLWKESNEGVTTGTHYWKIHITELGQESIFVGLTDLDKFQKGWALKGLLYGGPGNLSNGSALIVSEYGPNIKCGNTVGILAVFEEKLKVYFDVDGTPLGQAFNLPVSVLSGAFPVVHFSGNGKVSITKSSDIPTDLNRLESVYEGIEGDWKCIEYNGSPTPIKVTGVTGVTIGIFKNEEDDGKTYSVGLHVINYINFTLYQQDGIWKTSGGMSTLMGGSHELMQLESQMKYLVQTATTVEVDGCVLVISNGSNVTSKWERYSTAKSAVTENPFN